MSSESPTITSGTGREHRLFFLRGHMRSGTNWACAVLNLHPQINCRGEFHFERLAAAYDQFCARPWIDSHGREVADCARACLRDTVRRCIATAAASKPGALWQGDRTPARIDNLIEGAPTINIVRDGRDVLVSWAFHRLRMGNPFGRPDLEEWRRDFEADPESFVREPHKLLHDELVVKERVRIWHDHVRADRDRIASLRAESSPSRVHEITYEALHAEPERTRAGMYRFLGLDPEEASPLGSQDNTAPGFDRSEDPTSFYRRGEVAGWRDYFTPDATRWFKEESGDLLVELGYEKDTNW